MGEHRFVCTRCGRSTPGSVTLFVGVFTEWHSRYGGPLLAGAAFVGDLDERVARLLPARSAVRA